MPKHLVSILAFAMLAWIGSAGGAPAQQRNCFDCNQTGWTTCTNLECKKYSCPLIKTEHMCTKLFSFSCCRGLKKTPCKICGHLNTKSEFEVLLQDRADWIAECTADAKELRCDFDSVWTDNFKLRMGIEKLKVGDVEMNRHQLAHLYAARMEEMLVDYKKHIGDPYKSPMTQRWEIYICKNQPDRYRVAATRIGGTATSLYGMRTSMFIDGINKSGYPKDEEQLWKSLYHHVSQLVVEQGSPVGTRKYPGWLSEGFAHWMETSKWEKTENFCTGEVHDKDPWQDADWKSKVYSLVSKGKDPTFASWDSKGTTELNPMQHGLGWALVDFLIKAHNAKAGDLIRMITKGSTTGEAFQSIFGWSLAKVQEEWRAWVIKNYATK